MVWSSRECRTICGFDNPDLLAESKVFLRSRPSSLAQTLGPGRVADDAENLSRETVMSPGRDQDAGDPVVDDLDRTAFA
jgi:hypothetical protein